jgi:hypothetical protein
VNEATKDLEELRRAALQDQSKPAYPQTTMTTIVHLLRLKRIESEIQHKIYRVDNSKSSKAICATTDMFLEKLRAWKEVIPPQSKQYDLSNSMSLAGNDYRTYDSYVSDDSPRFLGWLAVRILTLRRWPPTTRLSESWSNPGCIEPPLMRST